MSLFFPLAWTDTDKGLTTRGGTSVCKTRPDSTKSRIASSTKSACGRDDLLFLKTAGCGKLTNGSKYPLSITLRTKLGFPIRFQKSKFYEDFPSSDVVGSWEEPPNIWLMAAENEFVGWALNFRVCMLLKVAVIGRQFKPTKTSPPLTVASDKTLTYHRVVT